MPRIRFTGQVYHADEAEVHLGHKFDFFTDIESFQDLDIHIGPEGTHTITALDYGMTSISTFHVFTDYGIYVAPLMDNVSMELYTREAMMFQRTTLDAVTITNPSTTTAIRVRVFIGGS